MLTLYRIGAKPFPHLKISQIDKHLTKLGFLLSENGAYYNKIYDKSDCYLNLGVICDNENIYDLMAFAKVKNSKLSKILPKIEKIYESNINVLSSMSMIKTAQGFGPEGGPGGLHNINLDETFGGQRWWSYGSDEESLDELENWLKHKQFRYNPEYLAVGRHVQVGDNDFSILGTVNDDVAAVRLRRDRQEPVLEYINTNNEVKQVPIPSLKKQAWGGEYDGDFAQELDKYQLKIARGDGISTILSRKTDIRGDNRGIWEINGKDAVPGFAYIGEDWRTSYSLHPEFLDDKEWTDGRHSPGRSSVWPY